MAAGPSNQKAQGFAITDFVLKKDFWEKEIFPHAKWAIAGAEICPESKRPHWQAAVYFKSKRSLNAVIKLFKPRHVEPMIASALANRKYCSKDGQPVFEFGTAPRAGKRNDLETIRREIESGASNLEIAQKHFGQWLRYEKGFERYRQLIEPKRRVKTKVIVLWGPSGVGKSHRVFEDLAPNACPVSFSANGDFILGYDGSPEVVFEEFADNKISRELFLKLTDKWPCIVNVKHGERNWNPRTIYITSNHDPVQWYSGDEAVKRRLDEVHKVVHRVDQR